MSDEEKEDKEVRIEVTRMNEQPREPFVPLTAETEKQRSKLEKHDKILILYTLFLWVLFFYNCNSYGPPYEYWYAFTWLEAIGVSGFLYGFIVYLSFGLGIMGTLLGVGTVVMGIRNAWVDGV